MTDKKKPAKEKKANGRPSKFGTINLSKVETLARLGWTDKAMAAFFDVALSNWMAWKNKHPKFQDALKDWKIEANARVERSLYERALGYSHPEDKIFKSAGEDPCIVPTIKHYPPDTQACVRWLMNRDPDNWREKQDGSDSPETVERSLAEIRQAILDSAVDEESAS